MKINEQYLKLDNNYLFSAVAQKVNAFKRQYPEKPIFRLGLGDVILPLSPSVIEALRQATAEMAEQATFRGYGEEQGYRFLRKAIAEYYQTKAGVELDKNEIFISDGAKSDLGNILDIFGSGCTVLIPNPTYPVYVDTNLMAGNHIISMPGNQENNFLPMPDEKVKADLIYLCSPGNPSGEVYDKNALRQWVDYALAQDAVILFDAAYEAFIQDADLPSSIYQIEGAKRCAIEFCSLSKTAGFTGTRCGYTVVPFELSFEAVKLRELWLRRQNTKFNGVSYIVQRAAEAVFSPEGRKESQANIAYYQENARLICSGLQQAGIWHTGGKNSPYIWMRCPKNLSSWEYFDYLLQQLQVVGTPGIGFGSNGEGFFRLTAFAERNHLITAIERIING